MSGRELPALDPVANVLAWLEEEVTYEPTTSDFRSAAERIVMLQQVAVAAEAYREISEVDTGGTSATECYEDLRKALCALYGRKYEPMED